MLALLRWIYIGIFLQRLHISFWRVRFATNYSELTRILVPLSTGWQMFVEI